MPKQNLVLGMPTLIELAGLEENARLCSSLGLRFLELNMNLPEYQTEALNNVLALQKVAEAYGIYYTIHLDENLNVSDFNRAVANAYLSTVAAAIKTAKQLHIPILNMHLNPGVYFTLPDGKVFLFERYREAYLKSIQAFKTMCETLIDGDDILITVENTDGYVGFQQEALCCLLESPVFALTWDIGHCHTAGNVDEPFLMQHKAKLKHFHIHDASGRQNHLALGTGSIDLPGRLLVARQNHCRCVIETKTVASLQQSVGWLSAQAKLGATADR